MGSTYVESVATAPAAFSGPVDSLNRHEFTGIVIPRRHWALSVNQYESIEGLSAVTGLASCSVAPNEPATDDESRTEPIMCNRSSAGPPPASVPICGRASPSPVEASATDLNRPAAPAFESESAPGQPFHFPSSGARASDRTPPTSDAQSHHHVSHHRGCVTDYNPHRE
jgi:hypothetical protein